MNKIIDSRLCDDQVLGFLQSVDEQRCAANDDQAASTEENPLGDVSFPDAHLDVIWEELALLASFDLPELKEYDRKQAAALAAIPLEKKSAKPRTQSLKKESEHHVKGSLLVFPSRREKKGVPIVGGGVFSGFRRYFASAAVIFVLIFSAVHYAGISQHFSVSKGQSMSHQLADGSVVEAASSAKLSITEGWLVRETSLESGYAYFHITPNPSKPFVVKTAGLTITVLGTSFSVYHKGDMAEVVVESGRVQVASNHTGETAGYAIDLVKNEKLIVTQNGHLAKTEQVDLDRELSWRNGMLYFEDETLADVLSKVREFYDHPIHILNSKHRSLKITGVYSVTDIDAFIEALAMISEIKVRKDEAGAITIY